MKRYYTLFFFILSVCLLFNLSIAKMPEAKDALKGIKEMAVIVDFNIPVGLNKNDIISDISLQLKQSGIKVTELDSSNFMDTPFIMIHHVAIPYGMTKSNYTSYLELFVYQKVKVISNGITTLGRTYSKSTSGNYKFNDASELSKSIKKQVDHFLSDYLDINPK